MIKTTNSEAMKAIITLKYIDYPVERYIEWKQCLKILKIYIQTTGKELADKEKELSEIKGENERIKTTFNMFKTSMVFNNLILKNRYFKELNTLSEVKENESKNI